MKPVGILQFPGTQCDRDIKKAISLSQFIFYKDYFNYKDYSAFILPGGFSYGDYLRAGALAAHSRSMETLREAGSKGWPILGICNGFQILCESKLLPGTLIANETQLFIDNWQALEVINKNTCFPCKNKINLPIAHGEGRYFIDQNQLNKLEDNNQIWLKYSKNPNGSFKDIAGIFNKKGNVAGLMPHPERAMSLKQGSEDGKDFFKYIEALQ